MLYVATFFLTYFLTCIYERLRAGKKTSFILALIIILLPSLLGGLRDVSVGTDNAGYFALYQNCFGRNYVDVISSPRFSSDEKGFLTLYWILSRIGNKNSYFLPAFATSFITFSFVFFAAKYYKDRYPMSLIIISYLFIYYCEFFNYVRQAMAVAIIFYSFRYIERKQLFNFIIFTIIASLFHISALIAIPIYFIFLFADRLYSKIYVGIFIICVIGFVSIGPSLVAAGMRILSNLGIMSHKLIFYSSMISEYDSYNYNILTIVRSLPQLIVGGLFYKRISIRDSNIKSYYILIWLQFGLSFIGTIFLPFLRISLYYNLSEFIFFAAIVESYKLKYNKLFYETVLFAALILYWYVFTVLNNYGFKSPVYPYVFNSSL